MAPERLVPKHSKKRLLIVSAFVALASGSGLLLAQVLVTTIVPVVPFIPATRSIATEKLRSHLVSNGSRLFWAESSDHPVKSISVTDGDVIEHVTRTGIPHRPALAPPHLFYLDTSITTSPSSCGTARALMRTAIDGTEGPVILARGPGCGLFGIGSTEVVVDTAYAYWVQIMGSPNAYALVRTPQAGGATVVVHSTNRAIVGLAIDDGSIYWAEDGLGGPGTEPMQVFKQSQAGGAPTLVATGVLAFFAGNIVVEGGRVYFADERALYSVSTSGGSVTALATTTERPGAVAVTDGTAYWLEGATIRAVPAAGGASWIVRDGLQSPADFDAVGSEIVWTESYCCPVSGRVLAMASNGGNVRIVAELIDAPRAVLLSGTEVFWTEGEPLAQPPVGAGRVVKAPIDGGPRVTVASGVASGTFTPLAVDQTNVYLADGYTLGRVPVHGGQVELLFRGPGGPLGIVDVATNDTHVIWLDEIGVRKMPLQGGAPVTLATGVDLPVRLAINSTDAFWIDWRGVHSVPLSGGASVTLTPFQSTDLAVDEAFAYVANQDSGEVARIAATGGSLQTLALTAPYSKTSLEVDETNVYWTDARRATINRMPKSGGGAQEVTGDVGIDTFIATALARDATGLSWTEVGAGRIRRAGPPVPPALTIQTNQSSVNIGDTLTVSARLNPGSGTAPVDAYIVQRLPDGGLRSLQLGGGFAPGLVPLGSGFVPFAFAGELTRFTIDGSWAPGHHEWLAGLTTPSTLNVIGSIATVPLTVGPLEMPGAPTLSPARVDGRTVHLDWVASATGGAAAGYRLEAGSGPGLSDVVPQYDLPPHVSAVTFPGVPTGSYYVRLRAYNWVGVSPPSIERTVVVR